MQVPRFGCIKYTMETGSIQVPYGHMAGSPSVDLQLFFRIFWLVDCASVFYADKIHIHGLCIFVRGSPPVPFFLFRGPAETQFFQPVFNCPGVRTIYPYPAADKLYGDVGFYFYKLIQDAFQFISGKIRSAAVSGSMYAFESFNQAVIFAVDILHGFCMKSLANMILDYVIEKRMIGVNVSRNVHGISYRKFAGDEDFATTERYYEFATKSMGEQTEAFEAALG